MKAEREKNSGTDCANIRKESTKEKSRYVNDCAENYKKPESKFLKKFTLHFRTCIQIALALFLLAFLLIVSIGDALAIQDLMPLQGTADNAGIPINGGNLQVTIWNQSSGGTLIYNSSNDYDNTVNNGRFDVNLGDGSQSLALEYGKYYYMGISVNGQALSFNGTNRKIFQATTGNVDWSKLSNVPSYVLTSNIVSLIGNWSADKSGVLTNITNLNTTVTTHTNDISGMKTNITTVNAATNAKATPANCPSGQFVQNTTTGGVQCATPASSGNTSTQIIAAVNNSGTLNISINASNILNPTWISSYTETDPKVNSGNITSLGFNTTVSLKTYFDTIYGTSSLTIAQVSSSIGNWSAERSGITTNITNLNTTVASHTSDVSGMKTNITNINNTVTTNSNDISGMKTNITGIDTSGIRTNVTNLGNINSSTNIESLGFNTTVHLKSYFDTIYVAITNLVSMVGNWSADKSGVLTNITNLNNTITTNTNDINGMKTNITNINNTETTNANDISGIKTNITNLNSSLTIATSDITNLKNANVTVNGLITSIGNYSADRTQLQSNLTNINATANSKAAVGNCAVGQVIQNITTSGVQCVNGPTPATYEPPMIILRNGTWISPATTATAAGVILTVTNTLKAVPLIVGKNASVDQIQFRVTTLVATSNCTAGIYTDDGNGYPSTLVINGSKQSCTLTGLKNDTLSSRYTLQPNILYWAVLGCGLAPTVQGVPIASISPVLGRTGTNDANFNVGWNVAYTYNATSGALPASFPVGGAMVANAIMPMIELRVRTD